MGETISFRSSSPPVGGNLPPPAYFANRCGVGFDGETGCRLCAEACPYEAIRPLNTPAGLGMHIDPGLCQRCGACTGVCPTSALQRAFLPDHEIDQRIEDALTQWNDPPNILFAHPASRPFIESLPVELPLAIVEIPSLLVLNETHLLRALRNGACGAAIVGHPEGHHGSPHLLDATLQITRAVLCREEAGRVAYIEDDGQADAADFLVQFIGNAPSVALPRRGPLAPNANRRQRFAALARESAINEIPEDSAGARNSSAELDDLPFGQVTVNESGCTLCGGCSRVCPSNALAFKPTEGKLTFKAVDCINCGLCAQACPEKVLAVAPGLRLGPALFERQTLVEDEVVLCRDCGWPHLPRRLLDHARKVLSGASAPSSGAADQIELCPACRSVAAKDIPPKARNESGCGNGQCGCDQSQPNPEPAGAFALTRRGFLAGFSVALNGLAALASGKAHGTELAGRRSGQPLQKRLGMVIDLERCIGCHACTAACKAENHVPLGVFRDWVEEHLLGEYPHAKPYFVPKLCNQCTDPGCLRACPTAAIYMRADGIVDLNHDICIGCRACNQACPYGVTFMDPVRGTADKCNFCTHRVDEGLNPACVDICPTHCRIFGDLNNPESPPSVALRGKPHQVLRQELGLGPNVRYLGLPAELDR